MYLLIIGPDAFSFDWIPNYNFELDANAIDKQSTNSGI